MNKFIFWGLLLSIFFIESAYATHNRAGELTFCKDPNSPAYNILITTYTKTPTHAYRYDHWVYVFYNSSVIDSFNLPKCDSSLICDSIVRSDFCGQYTFPGPGKYTLCMYDPNRIDNICNINNCNSVNTPFALEADINIFNPAFYGYDCSPKFTNEPIAFASINKQLIYNPGAYDPDGDSISFQFATPFENCLQPIVNFQQPIGMTINQQTGEITWTPANCNCCFGGGAIYNIAYMVNEYRFGQLIGRVERDMQIFVTCSNNHAPIITPVNEICVAAGNVVTAVISAQDVDLGDMVALSANGAMFGSAVANSATFTVIPPPSQNVSGTFNWLTDCADLRTTPYQLVLNAHDSIPGSSKCSRNQLTTNQTVLIHLVAPPPQNLTAVQVQSHIHLTWNNPYLCSSSPKFRYFTIWRKLNCDATTYDTCETDLASHGYSLLANGITTYNYDDYTAVRGQRYSYRVRAEFSDVGPPPVNNPYNPFSGMPSNEACIQFKLDIPVMLNVSVRSTDVLNGSLWLRWTKPRIPDLDTLITPPPYVFTLNRSQGKVLNNPAPVTSKTFASYHAIQLATDTSYIDTINIDTRNTDYSYSLSLFSNNSPTQLGNTDIASSVFISPLASDNRIDIFWNENVPWSNDSFYVYKKNKVTGLFDFLAKTTNHFYRDDNLINDSLYCYKVQSFGHYTVSGIPRPLQNWSQEMCARPIDTIPPCSPTLKIVSDCYLLSGGTASTNTEFFNRLSWNNPNESCANDVVKYYIYYTPESNIAMTRVDTISPATAISFNHHNIDSSLAGCYCITAIDSFGNESLRSDTICMDNCPIYILPNTFTPNGDGQNDLFHPFIPYRFVHHIDMKIFNRWGDEVFKTTNKEIGWDGKDGKTGKPLAAATYYYVCYVYEIHVTGIVRSTKPLSGFIELIR